MADTKRSSKTATTKPRSIGEELGKRDPFDLLEEEVYVNLLRTVDLLSSAFQAVFEPHQLSGPLYNALRIVGGEQKVSPEGISVGTISQRLVCRQPDTTRLIDRLEGLGYVKREASDVDGRKRMITITPKGHEVLQALHRPMRDLHRKQFNKLSPATLQRLNSLLNKVRAGLTIQ